MTRRMDRCRWRCDSVLLMSITEGRCYSTAEMRGWLEQAGFDWGTFGPTAIDRSYIVAQKRRG